MEHFRAWRAEITAELAAIEGRLSAETDTLRAAEAILSGHRDAYCAVKQALLDLPAVTGNGALATPLEYRVRRMEDAIKVAETAARFNRSEIARLEARRKDLMAALKQLDALDPPASADAPDLVEEAA